MGFWLLLFSPFPQRMDGPGLFITIEFFSSGNLSAGGDSLFTRFPVKLGRALVFSSPFFFPSLYRESRFLLDREIRDEKTTAPFLSAPFPVNYVIDPSLSFLARPSYATVLSPYDGYHGFGRGLDLSRAFFSSSSQASFPLPCFPLFPPLFSCKRSQEIGGEAFKFCLTAE